MTNTIGSIPYYCEISEERYLISLVCLIVSSAVIDLVGRINHVTII